MVAQHDSLVHAFRQGGAQIVAGVVVDQGAGVYPYLIVSLHQHAGVGTHEMRPAFPGRVFSHAGLGDFRAAVIGARGAQIRKGREGQTLRNAPFPEDLPKSLLYRQRIFRRVRLPGNGNPETLIHQPSNTLKGQRKAAFAPVCVMAGGVGVIQADPKMDGVGIIQQGQNLMAALQ